MPEQNYKGKCFCGAVELAVSGVPAAMGYCHCQSCRSWAAAPVNAFILWKREQVKIVKGGESIGSFNKTSKAGRKFCKICGGHLMAEHPEWGLTDVYAAVTPDFPFKPGVHVHYGEKVLEMHDGLPKFKDLPTEMGGSGDTVAE